MGGGKRESGEMVLPAFPPHVSLPTANGLLTILSGIVVKFLLRHE